MKPFITVTFLFICIAVYTQPEPASNFATKGIYEIGGSISTASTFDDDSTSYTFSFAPSIRYYVIDRVHIGIKPIYNYHLIYTKAASDYSSDYEILPVLLAGYTFTLKEKLYLNLTPQLGYRYSNIFSSDTDTQYQYLYYGLVCAFKFEYEKTLINVSLDQYYKKRISDEGPESVYRIALGLGFSIYF